MARKEELKEYVRYTPPWCDNYGSGHIDPIWGVSKYFIKDSHNISVSFDDLVEKFPINSEEYPDSLSFISQDGIIFWLSRSDKPGKTKVVQVYFDDKTYYPPNIKNARKETTAFKRWLLSKI